jgi:hypothetical protein
MKDLLERCETEMRYAGWSILEADNPQRQDLYFCVQAALAQQEPVAVLFQDGSIVKNEDLEFVPEKSGQRVQMLYTTPPQRTWVGLTEARIKEIWLKGKDHGDDWSDVLALARAFESELKEKNT